MLDESYAEPMDTSSQQNQSENSKLPPVLANLMGNLSSSSRSPQATNSTSNPAGPAVNVQELLSSIMVMFHMHLHHRRSAIFQLFGFTYPDTRSWDSFSRF